MVEARQKLLPHLLLFQSDSHHGSLWQQFLHCNTDTAVRFQFLLIRFWRIHDLGVIGNEKAVLRTLYGRKTRSESCGSIPEAISKEQRAQKRISSAWRFKFERKANFFDKNSTKSRFERAPSDISAIPTHPDGSRGPVRI